MKRERRQRGWVGVFAFFKNLGVTSRYKRTPKPSMWTRRTDKTPKTYGCSLDDFRGQSCPVQAWVVRRLTVWCLPRSRRRKTHVCIQRVVGILQRQRQTEDLCFHSSLHSHWFLFSRSSRLPRYLHFFGWEIIWQNLNRPKPYHTDTLATTYCTKLQS